MMDAHSAHAHVKSRVCSRYDDEAAAWAALLLRASPSPLAEKTGAFQPKELHGKRRSWHSQQLRGASRRRLTVQGKSRHKGADK